jgi:hypothetical protein
MNNKCNGFLFWCVSAPASVQFCGDNGIIWEDAGCPATDAEEDAAIDAHYLNQSRHWY